MIYYKVYDDSGFIGVGTTEDLRKHQKKHNILEFAEGSDAQFIVISDKIYHDKWMKKPSGDMIEWREVTIVAITEEEYEQLKDAVENELEISIKENEIDAPKEEYNEIPEFEDSPISVEYVRSVKVRELSVACNMAIAAGFNIEIGGEKLHFSMSEKDQLNLQDAAIQIISGQKTIPYHADGGEFTLFTTEEMFKIIQAANDHKTYHLAYFNALKKWVNSLKRISSIKLVMYGSEIPTKYQSAFLKSVIAGRI